LQFQPDGVPGWDKGYPLIIAVCMDEAETPANIQFLKSK
jgi:hypothetical protein